MDAADRGDSIRAADLVKTSPVKTSNNSPNRRRSHEQMETMINNASKENSKPKKNSKWARLAQEREGWDNDFQSSNQITEKEDRIVVAPKTPVKSQQSANQSSKKIKDSPKQLHQSGSARNMVTEALARAGKGHSAKNEMPKVKTTSTANTRLIEPKSNKPNARIEELQNTERSQRVSDLIQGFTPKKGTITPKRNDFPPMIEQTREPVEPTVPVEIATVDPSPKKRAHRLPNVEHKMDSIPKPSIASLSEADGKPRSSKYQEILTPNTKADLEIESMKRQIEEAKLALEKNKFESEVEEDISLDMSHREGPMLSSTIITKPYEIKEEESTLIEEFKIDDTVQENVTENQTVNITGYKKGHSLSFVKQQFDFLPEQSSMPELKEELTLKRTPVQIREDVRNGEYFEAGDTPNKKSKKKRYESPYTV
jgi:hypothetical protein